VTGEPANCQRDNAESPFDEESEEKCAVVFSR
jgi:hypothetical protein